MVAATLREIPLAIGAAIWVAIASARQAKLKPAAAAAVALFLGAGVNQFAGNTTFLFALGILGLALTVPVTLGTIIVSGAIIGRAALGEPVTRLVMLAIVTLVGAISLLGWATHIAQSQTSGVAAAVSPDAAPATEESNAEPAPAVPIGKLLADGSPWRLPIGFAAVLIAGTSFASLGVCVRFASNLKTQTPVTMLIVGATGATAITLVTLGVHGPGVFFDLAPGEWARGLAGGTCNLIAFFSITRAFQKVPVVFVNGINASQVAMAMIAGVLIFGEPTSGPLLAGVALTVVGLLLMARARAGGR